MVESYLNVFNVAFVCLFLFFVVIGGFVVFLVSFVDPLGVIAAFFLCYAVCGVAGYPVWWICFMVLDRIGLPNRLIGALASVLALWTSLAVLPFGIGFAFGFNMLTNYPTTSFSLDPLGLGQFACVIIGPLTALVVCGDE